MWQPIESAPRDGTEVLVAEDGDVVIARWIRGRWHGPRDSYGDVDYIHATHWQPLPEPPHAD